MPKAERAELIEKTAEEGLPLWDTVMTVIKEANPSVYDEYIKAKDENRLNEIGEGEYYAFVYSDSFMTLNGVERGLYAFGSYMTPQAMATNSRFNVGEPFTISLCSFPPTATITKTNKLAPAIVVGKNVIKVDYTVDKISINGKIVDMETLDWNAGPAWEYYEDPYIDGYSPYGDGENCILLAGGCGDKPERNYLTLPAGTMNICFTITVNDIVYREYDD